MALGKPGSWCSDDVTNIPLHSLALLSSSALFLTLRGVPSRVATSSSSFLLLQLTIQSISFLNVPANISWLTLLGQLGSCAGPWTNPSVQEDLVSLLARPGEMEMLFPKGKECGWAGKSKRVRQEGVRCWGPSQYWPSMTEGCVPCIKMFWTQCTRKWSCLLGGRGREQSSCLVSHWWCWWADCLIKTVKV